MVAQSNPRTLSKFFLLNKTLFEENLKVETKISTDARIAQITRICGAPRKTKRQLNKPLYEHLVSLIVGATRIGNY